MKFIQTAYYALIMLVLFSNSGISSPIFSKYVTEEPVVVTKASNVVYPSLLQDHRDESLQYVQQYSDKKREFIIKTYKKGSKYFSKVNTILKKYSVPQEMRVLIALESGFNPNATSSAGAKGYWQFMDEVAVEYGLKIATAHVAAGSSKKSALTTKKLTDDRTNFVKSTNAAARYLRDRLKNFDNDILLTVASYNCGIGNVWEAMKKSGIANPDFWDIKKYLPLETRNYVMNFISLNVVLNNYDKFISNDMVWQDVMGKPTPLQKESVISATTYLN